MWLAICELKYPWPINGSLFGWQVTLLEPWTVMHSCCFTKCSVVTQFRGDCSAKRICCGKQRPINSACSAATVELCQQLQSVSSHLTDGMCGCTDWSRQKGVTRNELRCINLLTPNVNYSWRTAPLTSKVAFYIFIQQI